MTRRLPAGPTPSHLLGDRCGAIPLGQMRRCLADNTDGSQFCARHTSLPVRRCSFVELDDDGVLVTCSTETVNPSGLCTAHEPQRNPLRGFRPVGLDVRGAR